MIFVASDSNIKDSVEKIVSPASQSSTKETNIKRHQIDPLDPFQDRWKTVDLGMAIWVVEFSKGGTKIRKVFA